MEQLATPLAPVTAVHDCVPLSVSVTVCPAMGCPVTEFVRVPVTVVGPPYCPVVALTVSVVGDWTVAGVLVEDGW
jgi:hypothetical protein